MDSEKTAVIISQFDSFRTTKDGGGKISFSIGLDSMDEIQKLLHWNKEGELNYTLVITPSVNLTEENHVSAGQ